MAKANCAQSAGLAWIAGSHSADCGARFAGAKLAEKERT